MATLKDLFVALHPDMSYEAELDASADGEPFKVLARCYYAFDSHSRYVAYYLTETAQWLQRFRTVVNSAKVAVQMAEKNVEVSMGPGDSLSPRVLGAELPFTGMVYLYAEQRLTDLERVELFAAGVEERGLRIDLRDLRWLDYYNEHSRPVAFLSHDSHDKDAVARPLVAELGRRMCTVWYDEYSLRIGDSLQESISRGISTCPNCIVIISPNFINNDGWSKAEFNAIMSRHINEGAVILPIWHEVGRAEVAQYSTLVVDTFAGTTANGIPPLADALMRALRPSPSAP